MNEGRIPSAASEDRRPRLLLVDDHEDNLDMLSRRLRRRGFEVVTSISGLDALTLLQEQKFDAILLDIMMPEMSGIEVLHEIRAQFSKSELPVVMATAKSGSEDVVNALRAGANDYVTKPIDLPVVLARLEAALAMKAEYEKAKPSAEVESTESIGPGVVLDGRYEIEHLIGEGGFAMVYKAKQLSTGQDVAVKILRSERVTGQTQAGQEVARFDREMKVIAELVHPGLVRLVDSGRVHIRRPTSFKAVRKAQQAAQTIERSMDDANSTNDAFAEGGGPATVPYFAMEFLRGETLADRIDRDRQLFTDDALEIMLPVICGVHALHEKGIVHRDLKPSNIFLARDSTGGLMPKVLDFGIAKLTHDGNADLTTDKAFVGTPSYMSPEQALGHDLLDARCDQYTLAAVLYELVAGRRPYQANNYTHMLMLIAEADYVPLDVVAAVPQELVDAIHTAMSADPEERFNNVIAFGRALLHAASDTVRGRWSPQLGHC